MFTVQAIEQAHEKVQTGAQFPAYIQEIKQMGVTAFETWVKDSHTQYFGADNFSTNSLPQYAALMIADKSDTEQFRHYLKIHQQGQTDYKTFCDHCAATGVEKWFVDLYAMTCTYYNKEGNEILVEMVPGI